MNSYIVALIAFFNLVREIGGTPYYSTEHICQMGLIKFRPGDLTSARSVSRDVIFEETFVSPPKIQVNVNAAGAFSGAIPFSAGNFGPSREGVTIWAKTNLPSATSYVHVTWIACGRVRSDSAD